MPHWFDISRWRETLTGRSAPRGAKPDPEPDLYQHRVQRIIAQNRRSPLPAAGEPEPAAKVSATDRRLTGMPKVLAGATAVIVPGAQPDSIDQPEESEHWISFGVGMAAGIACGWALLFFTMAAMDPEPSTGPRDGGRAIAAAPEPAVDKREDIAAQGRHEAARRVLERQVALATARVLTPPESGGVERVSARDLPVEEAAAPPRTVSARATPPPPRKPEPKPIPVLPTVRDAARPAPGPTVVAATTKPHFDFAGSGHMSRLGASNVTARDVFAQSNPDWAGPPPLPSRHPLSGSAKRKAAARAIGARRSAPRRGAAANNRRRRAAAPKVVRLNQQGVAAAPRQPEPEQKPLGIFSASDSEANWARRVHRLESGAR